MNDALSIRLPNPSFPQTCGIDVVLVLDRSNSVYNYRTTFKTAAKSFVDALTGTPSRIGVVSFRRTADSNLALTSVVDAAGATTVKNAIDAIVFESDSSEGGTNWEDGFQKARALNGDLIVFMTDGNPTTYTGSSDPGTL
ncbi:MAG: vWA domain-containing protein [Bacteroidales bacterium]